MLGFHKSLLDRELVKCPSPGPRKKLGRVETNLPAVRGRSINLMLCGASHSREICAGYGIGNDYLMNSIDFSISGCM